MNPLQRPKYKFLMLHLCKVLLRWPSGKGQILACSSLFFHWAILLLFFNVSEFPDRSASLANLLTPLKAGEAKKSTAALAEHKGNEEQDYQIL